MWIFLRGFFYGTPDEASETVQPFTNIHGAQATFRYVTFFEATQIDASIYPASETFRFAGRISCSNYSDSQIETLLQLIKKRACGSVFASIALYALGGRVRNTAPCDTAFYYRNADYIIGLETVWESPADQEDNTAWLHSRYGCLRSLTMGSYINFPYLHTDDYMNAYYGDNAERLICIKKQYDPCNLFCFAQSVK